jgi:nucleotide-binding universal stress UspA family protein
MPQMNLSPVARTYANIMLPMDLDSEAELRATLAFNLGDRFSSRLIGVAAQSIPTPMYFETPVEGVESILAIEERRAKENITRAEATFLRIADSRTNIEWRQALTFALDYTLEQARAADLIVAARPRRDEQAFSRMSVDGRDLVMYVGRPVLFVPPMIDHLSAERIVIGWKDTRESRRAVWDALPMLKAAKEVFVVSIGSKDHAAKDVATYLGRHGVAASPMKEPRSVESVGDELVRIAEAKLADLIVCGAYGRSRMREWVFGGVTRDLFDHAPICCLMAH